MPSFQSHQLDFFKGILCHPCQPFLHRSSNTVPTCSPCQQTILWHSMALDGVLCHAMPRYATLCHAMPRYGMLWHAMCGRPSIPVLRTYRRRTTSQAKALRSHDPVSQIACGEANSQSLGLFSFLFFTSDSNVSFWMPEPQNTSARNRNLPVL